MTELDSMVDIPFEVYWHETGSRADVFLSRRIVRMSRSLAARLIRAGNVRREPPNGAFKPSSKVYEGEQVVLRRRKLDEAPIDDIVIPTVFEDERVLAVCKPGNLVVHPTASAYHRTVIRVLRTRKENESLDLAHRIDKETSGLLLLAKDFHAASKLKGQFAKRQVKKSYLAVVRGAPREDRFVINAPLRLVPDSETSVLMEVGGPADQPALTEVLVLARSSRAALVEARPKTGRQHQIRVHLKSVGHPILGDKLYIGGEDFFIRAVRGDYSEEELIESLGHVRQALHAYSATFEHPETEEQLTLRAPPPDDFMALLDRVDLEFARPSDDA